MTCAPDGYKFVLPENIEAMLIIDKYIQFFYDGMNGMKLESIFLALQHEERMDLLDKVKVYTFAALIERTKKTEPVRKINSKRGKK